MVFILLITLMELLLIRGKGGSKSLGEGHKTNGLQNWETEGHKTR